MELAHAHRPGHAFGHGHTGPPSPLPPIVSPPRCSPPPTVPLFDPALPPLSPSSFFILSRNTARDCFPSLSFVSPLSYPAALHTVPYQRLFLALFLRHFPSLFPPLSLSLFFLFLFPSCDPICFSSIFCHFLFLLGGKEAAMFRRPFFSFLSSALFVMLTHMCPFPSSAPPVRSTSAAERPPFSFAFAPFPLCV